MNPDESSRTGLRITEFDTFESLRCQSAALSMRTCIHVCGPHP
jgi:hypothetical protein